MLVHSFRVVANQWFVILTIELSQMVREMDMELHDIAVTKVMQSLLEG